jgi:chorismate dehydratase
MNDSPATNKPEVTQPSANRLGCGCSGPCAVKKSPACRIGAVSYLNSKPLVACLPAQLTGESLTLDYPSLLAEKLVNQQLDVALVPSIEWLRHPELQLVSDACVATHGPVLSVKVFFRVLPANVQTLALDAGSRTSASLAQILLAERYEVFPRLVSLPLEQGLAETTADAVLLIGDRAMATPTETFVETWDLGAEWVDWTGLPFVFAVWLARPGCSNELLANRLAVARDEGVKAIPQIATLESKKLGLSVEATVSYLRDHLFFKFEEAERAGLARYFDLARKWGLATSLAIPRQSSREPAAITGLLDKNRTSWPLISARP